MKNTKTLLCCMLILLAGCASKNEEPKDDQNKVVEPATNNDIASDKEDEKEENKEINDEEEKDEVLDQNDQENAEPIVPSKPAAPAPSEPEAPKDEPEETLTADLDALATAIQATDLFSMSMMMDNQQIADLYGGIGTDHYETAIVLKNLMSPGGDEAAIFKVKANQMDAVKAGINARDTYGKNEGSFYEMEQEMFNNSKIIEIGDIIVYIAARNVDEVASIVETNLK
ncbi:DUF4358 domain-containing protein [Dielma fastidiosa]|uniref:Uncharacterized protein DUF4358 n=1 Tax=Dielma fastidiosa TaxID=1034346 RepID=A0A318KQ30_9FIRM|nr:DUF4358 domain-containing protein [Dielma fastidiosa]PXX77835.1 uncharacterized protein DUF4358 [Dielma fastidiosa]